MHTNNIDLVQMILSFYWLRTIQNKDLLGTQANFFLILTGIFFEQISSCKVIATFFFNQKYFLTSGSILTLARHEIFHGTKRQKISSTQNVAKEFICNAGNMRLTVLLGEARLQLESPDSHNIIWSFLTLMDWIFLSVFLQLLIHWQVTSVTQISSYCCQNGLPWKTPRNRFVLFFVF